MAGTGKKILILIISLAIGMGVTYFSMNMIEPYIQLDQMIQIVIAVVLTLFAYIAFYFMTKGSG